LLRVKLPVLPTRRILCPPVLSVLRAGIVLKALRITPQIITTLAQTMNVPKMELNPRKKTPILRTLTIKRVHPARKAKMRMALHRITMEITALKNRPAQKLNSQGVQQPVLQVHS